MDPNFGLAHGCLGTSSVNEGHFQEGIPELKKATELLPGSPYFMAQLGMAYALAGDRAQAQKVLDQMKKIISTAPPKL